LCKQGILSLFSGFLPKRLCPCPQGSAGQETPSPAAAGRRVVVRNPDDAKLLSCAAAGGADYIVSGDKNLLSLSEYEGAAIVTPSDFVRILSAIP